MAVFGASQITHREQGVDELLQLKLHQALASTDEVPPNATIVLATGDGNVGQAIRSKLALKAFEMTAKYDDAISGYFREQYASSDTPKEQLAGHIQRTPLRYGANPHQKPAQAFVTEGELPFKGMFSPLFYVYAPRRTVC